MEEVRSVPIYFLLSLDPSFIQTVVTSWELVGHHQSLLIPSSVKVGSGWKNVVLYPIHSWPFGMNPLVHQMKIVTVIEEARSYVVGSVTILDPIVLSLSVDVILKF